ncbi:MAG: hypothetical protein RR531_11025, partial [Longicatena sp.]
MKKTKRKSVRIEKRIIAFTLAFVIGIVSINPNDVAFAYSDIISDVIDATFSEVLSEDKQTTNVKLEINEKENQTIESVTLPDGTKVMKDTFKYTENSNIFVEFTASSNGKLTYIVTYTETLETAEDGTSTSTEPKDENISFDVETIKSFDDMKLSITADDIQTSIGEKIDLLKGITIKDEDDKDVSDTTAVTITDEDGFDIQKAGTYEITYSAEHPISKMEFSFTRKVQVKEKEVLNADESKTASESTKKVESIKSTTRSTSSDAKITLSESNASLKTPEDFVIGHKEQNDFNLTLSYNPASDAKNRVLKFYIPSEFKLTKEISKDDLSYATVVSYETLADGTKVGTIEFSDGPNITVGFDINIQQDKKILYDNANISDRDYAFKVEGYSEGTKVSEDNLTLHTDKLRDTATEELITMNPINATIYYDRLYDVVSFQNTDTSRTVSIKKAALSNLNVKELTLPRNIKLDDGELYGVNFAAYQLLDSKGNVVKKGGSLSTSYQHENYKTIDLSKALPEFLYAYEDMELQFTNVYLDTTGRTHYIPALYDSPETPWTSLVDISFKGYKNFGKLMIDPQLKE